MIFSMQICLIVANMVQLFLLFLPHLKLCKHKKREKIIWLLTHLLYLHKIQMRENKALAKLWIFVSTWLRRWGLVETNIVSLKGPIPSLEDKKDKYASLRSEIWKLMNFSFFWFTTKNWVFRETRRRINMKIRNKYYFSWSSNPLIGRQIGEVSITKKRDMKAHEF